MEGNGTEKRRRRKNKRKNYENYDFIFPQICDFIIITTRMIVMTLFLLSATAYPMLLCDMTLAIADIIFFWIQSFFALGKSLIKCDGQLHPLPKLFCLVCIVYYSIPIYLQTITYNHEMCLG